MTQPVVKGWCPGALRPMLSGDGWVLRIRPRLGRLTGAEARGVAALSARFGNGWMDLSSRANLQIRGVRPEAIGQLTDGLAALGLLDADIEAETRRNILVTPFHAEGDASEAIATELAVRLARGDATGLPAKFGFSVDAGSRPVLSAAPADIRIERGANGELLCRADGAEKGAPVTLATAPEAAMQLARWFLESGGAPRGRGRMAAHVRGGAPLPPEFQQAACPQSDFAPRPGPTPVGAMVALAFGQMRAETLDVVARTGDLRLTPWRMVVLEGRAVAPEIEGLISDAENPLLKVVACTGAPGCLQAYQPTRGLARSLAGRTDGLLHISGCTKGCAHPAVAATTLVGAPDGFALIRHGKPDAAPIITGLGPDPAALAAILA